MNLDNAETYDSYYDMEDELERGEVPEKVAKIWRDMATSYLSQEQLADKGSLLGHYKSGGLFRTYIDVYEKAFIGKAEVAWSKKAVDIRFGYVCLTEALVEKGILYLIMNDDEIYRIKHLKMAEEIAYRMNEQKRMMEG